MGEEESKVPPSGIRFNPTDDEVTLPPGFRFHPTDEELLSYYLKRKISGKTLHFNAISEVDLYKCEPWDLPEKSCLKNRDLEWYFFSPLDKKYGIGSRTNRATECGYWKVTGKDREIRCKSKRVGLKKTLVFHQGRAPRGERTNWVMHEYRLADGELTKAGIQQNSFVLCRIFQKSGPGPKIHEQYGASFIEEEWDESVAAPEPSLAFSLFSTVAPSSLESPKVLSNNRDEKQLSAYGSGMQDSCDQTRDIRIRRENAFLTPVLDRHDSCNYFENGGSFFGEQHADQNSLDPTVEDGSYLEINDLWNSTDDDCPTDATLDPVPYFDAPPADNPAIEDRSFLEVNGILNTMEPEATGFEMLDELLTYFDATDGNFNTVDLHPASGADIKNDNKGCWDDGILSKLVGSIPLPSEAFTEPKIPMKGAKSVAAASSSSAGSIHVTATMIHTSNVTVAGVGRKDLSSSKTGYKGFLLSFGFSLSRDDDWINRSVVGNSSVGSVALIVDVSEIEMMMLLWNAFYIIFLMVSGLAATFKLGSDTYARY